MEFNKTIKIRKSKATDAEFAFKAIKETMRDHAIATWGKWHEKDSKQFAIENTQSGKVEIVEINGKSVGVILVTRKTKEIEILILKPDDKIQLAKTGFLQPRYAMKLTKGKI